jgi:hypothetical protein
MLTASALFALSAVALLAKWGIFLFVAVPERQTLVQHVQSLLGYVFTTPELAWFFVVMAASPFLFVALAIASWRSRAATVTVPLGVKAAALASVLCALLVLWPVAFFAGPATYFLVRHNAA